MSTGLVLSEWQHRTQYVPGKQLGLSVRTLSLNGSTVGTVHDLRGDGWRRAVWLCYVCDRRRQIEGPVEQNPAVALGELVEHYSTMHRSSIEPPVRWSE